MQNIQIFGDKWLMNNIRFSMYPPSMLSSAALAHSAQALEKRSLCQELNVSQLITRLQLLTRVENVSTKYQLFIYEKHYHLLPFRAESFNFTMEMMIISCEVRAYTEHQHHPQPVIIRHYSQSAPCSLFTVHSDITICNIRLSTAWLKYESAAGCKFVSVERRYS